MLTADRIYTLNGVVVKDYIIANHNSKGVALPPKRSAPLIGVTIHNTNDLVNVHEDSEQYTRATVNGNMGTVVPNYYVDDVSAWRLVGDDNANWTCADGKGMGNMRTIALEVIMDGSGSPEDLKAEDNAARLAAYLLCTNSLTADDLYTHTHWLHVRDGHKGTRDELNVRPHSYKMCPYYIIPHWNDFKARVRTYFDALKSSEKPTAASPSKFPYCVKVIADELNVRSAPGTASKVVCKIKRNEVYTIVEEYFVGAVPWGRLKSGELWISLLDKYVTKTGG